MSNLNKVKQISVGDSSYDIDAKYWGNYTIDDVKTINGESIFKNGSDDIDTSALVEVIYEELVTLRDNSQLVPGRQYRITDYVTTTVQENTKSAGHQFDIIVTADDVNILNENARACKHEGDTYFETENLEAWQLKYCIDNDGDRFAWVNDSILNNYDSSNCEIKDEFNDGTDNGGYYALSEYIEPQSIMMNDPVNGDAYGFLGKDIFGHYGYEIEPNGSNSLYLLGSFLEIDDETNEIISNDGLCDTAKYYYRGIVTVDDEEYDCWQKWDGDSGGYIQDGIIYYYLTNRIVDGEIIIMKEKSKGVIYRMIDEWGNDCPYDFKNIMFKRWLCTDGGGVADKENGDFIDYCYTFSYEESNGNIIDVSIFGNNGYLLNDESDVPGVYRNIMGVCRAYDSTDNFKLPTQYLNNNVFFNTFGYDESIFYGLNFNTLGNNCQSNSFGNECSSNTFGNECSSNTFGDYCSSNTFGNECYSNTFVNNCYNNIFGDGCHNNTFGDDCYYNTFGNYCYNNTFGNNCSSNTFGNKCGSNTFGNNCGSNTFGNNCYSNTFGNECYSNTFGDGCHNNTFGDYCSSNTFGNNCYSNTFGDDCYYNTFGNNCDSNTFGNEYYSNTFGNNCYSNTFGDECDSNTFGNNCYSNTFGKYCIFNTFGNKCHDNTFGDDCYYNTFGDGCHNNTFGDECGSNTFGNNCYSNTFGKYCISNTFGNSCSSNIFGLSATSPKAYYKCITFDSGNRNIMLNCTETTSSSKYYQNVRIALGVNNTSTYKEISDPNVGQTFETVYRPANSQTITI